MTLFKTRKVVSACLVIIGILHSPVYAKVCQDAPGVGLLVDKNIAAVVSPAIGVTPCDLQSYFDEGKIPKFYWSLKEALQQGGSVDEILNTALSLANVSGKNNQWDKTEKIYKIVLSYFPVEPRFNSSYAALKVKQQKLGEAQALLEVAARSDANDPLILNNLFLLYVLNSDYANALKLNKAQIALEPDFSTNYMRKAILTQLFGTPDSANWEEFFQTLKSDDQKQYWKQFYETVQHVGDKKQYSETLTQYANQWIDSRMVYEALILLDYVDNQHESPMPHFMKAKAYERERQFKLAYESVKRARRLARDEQEAKPAFYKSILYELGRLAYATKKYQNSLEVYGEYSKLGDPHPHLDYLFAVNYNALGRYDEAKLYFQKCVKQDLPENMHSFCERRLATLSQAKKPSPKKSSEKTEIRLSGNSINPMEYMKGGIQEAEVTWFGEVAEMKIEDLGDRVHIRWLVDFYRPTQEVMISDGREYSIDVNHEEPPQLFIVNLFLNAPSDESKKSIRKGFEDETHIVVKGRAVDVEPVNRQLAPVVAMERGIFTSKIRIKR